MARSERLLTLTQALRRRRRPVTAATLAAELQVSERTIYRDVASLQGTGVPIRGEAGIGYILEPGYDLPPLMLTPEEGEALMLGARFVRERGDPELRRIIDDAIAKIEAVLPESTRLSLREAPLYAPLYGSLPLDRISTSQMRRAVRDNRKLRIGYRDPNGQETERTVWPVLLGYFERSRVLIGFCELRQDFRTFRTDRIETIQVLEERPPLRRAVLLRQWEKHVAEQEWGRQDCASGAP
ncbi:YafY family protein [Rhabdaerophilum sp. SD176]|uniref:helix-turn-helix transcriptional regulator n=1 Tax=Rhabdaerophilum sp. SD176 TaxID=2983548 RepID=UPI0024DF7134|nr:YafY family protein [Rhabdaerophilum sp. SD176]